MSETTVNTYYRIEWIYKNSNSHWTLANSLEMAQNKAKPYIENENVFSVVIIKCEEVESHLKLDLLEGDE